MAATDPKREPEYDAGHIPMTEELDDAKHNMPDAAPVIIALVIVAIVVAAAAFFFRQTPAAHGSIGDIWAMDVPSQGSVLVTMPVTVSNATQKPLTIRGVFVAVHTDQGDLSDNAAPSSDFTRYLTAFPALKDHSVEPFKAETKLAPGQEMKGSVLVSYPLTKEKFDKRKGVTVTVELYDYTDLKINK